MLDYGSLAKQAQKLHDNAKDGVAVIDGVRYEFRFNRTQGHYEVLNGSHVETRLNTRKITVAKKWFREYLAS